MKWNINKINKQKQNKTKCLCIKTKQKDETNKISISICMYWLLWIHYYLWYTSFFILFCGGRWTTNLNNKERIIYWLVFSLLQYQKNNKWIQSIFDLGYRVFVVFDLGYRVFVVFDLGYRVFTVFVISIQVYITCSVQLQNLLELTVHAFGCV